MDKRFFLRKIFILFFVLVIILTITPLATSCKKETTFGNLIICESVKKDTYEPVNPKNEFDLFTKEIAAAINVQNVKGTDNYRFLCKNAQSGEMVSDISGKYQEGETRYGSGWFESTLSVKQGAEVIALPGNYVIEFYHNGELKSSANFKIKEPQAKILSVSLAKEINDKKEPVKTTQEFNSGETIYACVQIDYLIPGNKLTAKWFDEKGNVITETPVDITDPFYKSSWIAFTLESADKNPLPAGKYKVEIYYNNEKYNEFSFSIAAAAQAGALTFDKGNVFTEAQGKYYFTMKYPDSCNYTWQEDNTGMNVRFTPLNANDAYSTMMIVLNKESAPGAADYTNFADEIAKQSTQGMEQAGDKTISDRKLVDGTPYKEYVYYFNDKTKGEFGLILGFISKFDKLYIWYGFAHKSFYDQLNASYYGSLSSIVLKK